MQRQPRSRKTLNSNQNVDLIASVNRRDRVGVRAAVPRDGQSVKQLK
jgi:hypothetical protein